MQIGLPKKTPYIYVNRSRQTTIHTTNGALKENCSLRMIPTPVITIPNYLSNTLQNNNINIFKTSLKNTSLLHFSKDTRYVILATTISLAHISINECNPESHIQTNSNTIQRRLNVAHIYEDNGQHLITIPKTRLLWLSKQYQHAKNTPHGLEPPIQSFETEIVWLYQRYKYRILKNDPLKCAQYTIPT